MKYKASFAPAELLDTATNNWHQFDDVLPLLDQHRRAYFDVSAQQDASSAWPCRVEFDDVGRSLDLPRPLPLGFADPSTVIRSAPESPVLLLAPTPVLLPIKVCLRIIHDRPLHDFYWMTFCRASLIFLLLWVSTQSAR